MSESALEYVKKWSSKMNVNLDFVLNIAELGASTASAYLLIAASIFGKASIMLLSIVFLSTIFLSYFAFKDCESEILKNGVGLFIISLINAAGTVGIMWTISNTWDNFKSNQLYITLLISSPILVYIFAKILERVLSCGDHYFILFPLQKIMESPLAPLINLSMSKAAKFTNKLIPSE
jgi:hypothetical protein